jgi:hypothetical protein
MNDTATPLEPPAEAATDAPPSTPAPAPAPRVQRASEPLGGVAGGTNENPT